jgi:hypothetical protein
MFYYSTCNIASDVAIMFVELCRILSEVVMTTLMCYSGIYLKKLKKTMKRVPALRCELSELKQEVSRIDILMVVKIMFFWVLLPCRLKGRYQHFRKRYCLQLNG